MGIEIELQSIAAREAQACANRNIGTVAVCIGAVGVFIAPGGWFAFAALLLLAGALTYIRAGVELHECADSLKKLEKDINNGT